MSTFFGPDFSAGAHRRLGTGSSQRPVGALAACDEMVRADEPERGSCGAAAARAPPAAALVGASR